MPCESDVAMQETRSVEQLQSKPLMGLMNLVLKGTQQVLEWLYPTALINRQRIRKKFQKI